MFRLKMGAALLAGPLACQAQVASAQCLRVANAEQTIEAMKTAEAKYLFSAHRACWDNDFSRSGVPENSALALETCKALGVEIAEIDLRLSKDNRLIVFHDSSLKRMTGESGTVGDFDAHHLTRMRLDQGDGRGLRARPTSQNVLTLEDALEIAGDELVLAIDAKDDVRHMALTELVRLGAIDRAIFIIPASESQGADVARLAEQGAMLRLATAPGLAPDGAEAVARLVSFNPIAIAVSRKEAGFFEEARKAASENGIVIWASTFGSEADGPKGWDDSIASGAQILQIDNTREAAIHRATNYDGKCDR